MNIVVNCNLCDEKSLHIRKMNGDFTTRQCINCGYTTNDKLKGEKTDNDFFKVLSDFIKKHSVEEGGHIWIPSVLTLPAGSLYPVEEKDKLKWAFASLVDVNEDEKESFPVEGQKDKYHTKKLDTENAKIYDEYILALAALQEKLKVDTESDG